MHRVMAALLTQFTAQSLEDSFTGDIWEGSAPNGTDFPYIVVNHISTVNQGFTSGSSGGTGSKRLLYTFRFDIYYQEAAAGDTDPVTASGNLMETFDTGMEFASLSLPAGQGTIISVMKTNDRLFEHDRDRRIHVVQLEYDILREKPITCSGA